MTATRIPHQAAEAITLNDLDTSLANTTNALTQLVALAERKLVALRSADTITLHQTARLEKQELERTFALEQERSAIVARVAQGLPGRKAERLRLSEIAECLPAPWNAKIGEKTRVLKRLSEMLQQKNRLAAGVAQNLHKHIRAVMEELATSTHEPHGYRRDGRREHGTANNWVDAIG